MNRSKVQIKKNINASLCLLTPLVHLPSCLTTTQDVLTQETVSCRVVLVSTWSSRASHARDYPSWSSASSFLRNSRPVRAVNPYQMTDRRHWCVYGQMTASTSRQLFNASAVLEKRAAACSTCHSIDTRSSTWRCFVWQMIARVKSCVICFIIVINFF